MRANVEALVLEFLRKVRFTGCDGLVVDHAARTCRIGNAHLSEGELICLDGATGHVFLGSPAVVAEVPEVQVAEIERWRKLPLRALHKMRVRADSA